MYLYVYKFYAARWPLLCCCYISWGFNLVLSVASFVIIAINIIIKVREVDNFLHHNIAL